MTEQEAFEEVLACTSEGFGVFPPEQIAKAFWTAALEWAKSELKERDSNEQSTN